MTITKHIKKNTHQLTMTPNLQSAIQINSEDEEKSVPSPDRAN